MGRVDFNTALIRFHRSIVTFELFEDDGAIEVQKQVVGKMLQRPVEHCQGLRIKQFTPHAIKSASVYLP